MTIAARWGLAWEHWVVSDTTIPHEARFIPACCLSLGSFLREDCMVSPICFSSICSYFCRKFFESSFHWKGKRKDKLIVLKCNFVAELFIAPSASVASGVLSSEMPLKLITSMPLCLFPLTFPWYYISFFSYICWESYGISIAEPPALQSYRARQRWISGMRQRLSPSLLSFCSTEYWQRFCGCFFLLLTLHDSDYQINS